jgi:hypothetical protein
VSAMSYRALIMSIRAGRQFVSSSAAKAITLILCPKIGL